MSIYANVSDLSSSSKLAPSQRKRKNRVIRQATARENGDGSELVVPREC